jgi:hypothetical protein
MLKMVHILVAYMAVVAMVKLGKWLLKGKKLALLMAKTRSKFN